MKPLSPAAKAIAIASTGWRQASPPPPRGQPATLWSLLGVDPSQNSTRCTRAVASAWSIRRVVRFGRRSLFFPACRDKSPLRLAWTTLSMKSRRPCSSTRRQPQLSGRLACDCFVRARPASPFGRVALTYASGRGVGTKSQRAFAAAIEVAVALARLRAVQERAAPGGSPVRSPRATIISAPSGNGRC
jgi:hypothetical protein